MKQREIKFRVWDKFQNKFLDHSCYFNSKDFNEFTAFDRYFKCDEEGCIVQQYTALKDKNGREIYEGDIIQLENAPYKYEVVWNKWHWGIDSKGIVTDFIQSFTIAVEERCIVIGNIFENPDLLK